MPMSFLNTPRVDALDKVRGRTRYGADDARPGLLHAMLLPATIARGRVARIDARAARAAPGVRLVLTHEDLGDLKPAGFLGNGGFAFQNFQPMLSAKIAYRGQPVAMVVADTLEQAVEGARLVRPTFEAAAFNVVLGDAAATDILAQANSPLPKPAFADRTAGDADAAFAAAPVKVDAAYTSPPQHQNPMELISTVAEWQGDTLVIHEGTQNAESCRQGLARQLGLSPAQVQVRSPTVGGGFGQKNSLQMQTLLAAVAARRLGRPVKIVVPRTQLFHNASFRPASRHRVRLGADRAGKLLAAIHEIDHQTARHTLFPLVYADLSARLHGIENFRGRERLVQMDTQAPGFMRAPFEHAAAFAFESAVDEMAQSLGQDPVALRLANDTKVDPITKRPLSSRHLAECLRAGAERFGWSRRDPVPGSMRAADGTLIGWGVAAGAYKASSAPAVAKLRVTDDGGVVIAVGVHEMGQGIRTALANVLAAKLGISPERVTAEIGVTGATPQHVTAGSWGTATAVPAASEVADALLAELRKLDPGGTARQPAEILKAAGRPFLEVEVRRKAPGQPDAIFDRLAGGQVASAGPAYPEFVSLSYVAHFVEVRVESTTRRVRVPRVVSIVDCGRVVSPRTAESQVRGGVVWGIGAALREASEVDGRYGGFLNADLAEYVIPVNADIGAIEVDFIDEPDPLLNREGVKGLGEVAMVGLAPAIANAVHHATGRRVRDLPIRIEHLVSPSA
ncbi:xanthine dehydrogenase family protein molybdopterin-binding subunit [Methylobacterium oryzisoli]|uniref:xanthine dehydrogenase family protein molybdopterin-binding subunit n=1 Tax=Methylobacterium oryzisoli TaxID=3385502 RepID=UPI003891BC15